MSASLRLAVEKHWQRRGLWACALYPLSLIYAAVAHSRRVLYRSGVFASGKPGVPVIVVGNISVGGSGKTPLVIALARKFKRAGRNPGVLSRGWGRRDRDLKLLSPPSAANCDQQAGQRRSWREFGDEPLLISEEAQVPVAVGRNRRNAAEKLVSDCNCNLIIADDGLQHYPLARDLEIALVGSSHGNGWLLPAGPLRESPRRLDSVDIIVREAAAKDFTGASSFVCRPRLAGVRPLAGGPLAPLVDFAGTRVHAVAGIARPGRFFNSLRREGIEVVEHPFPDHHPFVAEDFAFAADQELPVWVTQKDAVKLRSMNLNCGIFVVVLEVKLPDSLWASICQRLRLEPPEASRVP